ncbi:MAG: RsmG family class I SAM-dependent methyltransferase [Terriglobales bacterium]|jgi:16S rRNA (guanine(527)-N(7))-methyltransferase RsmG
MDSARIAALLEPFLGPPCDRRLTTNDLDKISTYIDLLLRWNARINLTAIRIPEEIVTRHFGESFFLARHLFPRPEAAASAPLGNLNSIIPNGLVLSAISQTDRSAGAPAGSSEGAPPSPPAHSAPTAGHVAGNRLSEGDPQSGGSRLEAQIPKLTRVLDIGSGAGFPALPIKIWSPDIHLTLIESNHKKAAFLREVIRTLTLMNVNVIADRAENVLQRFASISSTSAAAADVVTFRAVEKFERILPLAGRFLAPRGRLAVLISSVQLPAVESIERMKWTTSNIPESYMRLLSIGELHNDQDKRHN